MVVADTAFLIDVLAGQARAVAKLQSLVAEAEPLSIPAPALHELHYGAGLSRDPGRELARIAEIERAMAILPFGAPAARLAGAIEADLESRGRKAGRADVQIAAIALARGDRVLTRDRRFPRPTGLGLDLY